MPDLRSSVLGVSWQVGFIAPYRSIALRPPGMGLCWCRRCRRIRHIPRYSTPPSANSAIRPVHGARAVLDHQHQQPVVLGRDGTLRSTVVRKHRSLFIPLLLGPDGKRLSRRLSEYIFPGNDGPSASSVHRYDLYEERTGEDLQPACVTLRADCSTILAAAWGYRRANGDRRKYQDRE
jgi:hypothetical protein